MNMVNTKKIIKGRNKQVICLNMQETLIHIIDVQNTFLLKCKYLARPSRLNIFNNNILQLRNVGEINHFKIPHLIQS